MTQVAIYSEKYAAKAKRDRYAVVEKARQLISCPSKYAKSTSYGAAKYIKNLAFDPKTGEVISTGKKLLLDEERLIEEERFDGYYVVVTSELDKGDFCFVHLLYISGI